MAKLATFRPDVLDTIRGGLTMTVEVRPRNLWRLKLGAWLIGLAALVLRCPVDLNPESPAESTD
jgi:hypothetical protein